MEDRAGSGGHLPTMLRGLDDALCGGIPFGALTELVGPPGIGKTQVRGIVSEYVLLMLLFVGLLLY